MQLKVRIPTIKLTRDNIFILLAVVMFCHYSIFDYVAVVIGKLPIISSLKDFFFPILYVFLTLLSLKATRFRWLRISDIGIILFFVMSILISLLFYPESAQYIKGDLWKDILPCLPFFLLGLCLELDEKTYKTMGIVSCIAILINVVYVFYFVGGGRTLGGSHGEDYSMHRSYVLLPNTLIAMDYSFKSKKVLPSICSAAGVIYALAMGTRGPVVILTVFLVICIWRYLKFTMGKKILLAALLGTAVMFFVYSSFYMESLLWIKEMLKNMGFSTRVVEYLIEGEMISETSGRDDIFRELLQKLSARPILGYGVYGEYAIGHVNGAHNIFLQVVFHYGYLLGGLLLVSYILVFINGLARTKEMLAQGWIALFGCWVFVGGIFGGSYLDYSVFFLLGLCLKEIRAAKYRLREGQLGIR